MPVFKYKGLDLNGGEVSGRHEASSEKALHVYLDRRSIQPYKVVKLPPQINLTLSNASLSFSEMARFVRQLATLLSAGVSVLDAMQSLSKSSGRASVSTTAKRIATDLRTGLRLSHSLEQRLPKLPTYVFRLAELGETTGNSAQALADAAERMEYEASLKNEIKTSLAYPVFLSIVGTILILIMFVFVVPRFTALIGDDLSGIPWVSQIVLKFGSWVSQNTLFFLGLSILFIVILFGLIRTPKVKFFFRGKIELLPVIGTLLKKADFGAWSRTVGVSLKNGADLMQALHLGQDSLSSEYLKKGFANVAAQVRTGQVFEEAVSENVPDFDGLSLDLIKTGRLSGTLAEMLLFIGNEAEKETRERAKKFAAIAEPLAILIISAVIGLIVISIVLAMTSIYDFT